LYVVGSDEETEAKQRARSRAKAAEKRRRDAQLPTETRTIIDKYPHVKASTLATWLQDRSATRSLPGVTRPDGEPMEPRSLAKKIIRYRRQK
jgi:hypothetical protein